MIASELSYVGWVTRDPWSLHARFERLGFRLTPWASHVGSVLPGSPPVPFGTANRCAMLRQGYLEMVGVADPSRPLGGLERYLDRYEGLHVVSLAMDDAEANLARLQRAGVPMPGLTPLERPFSDADADGPRARFTRLPLPEAPEGRVQLIQHHTPELQWRECFLDHPNRATALEAAILVVENPASSAARLSRFAGRPVVPDPLGGFALPLPGGVVRILPPEALAAVLPGVSAPALPCIAAAIVRVDDQGQAARALLGAEAREMPGGILAEAGGGWVLFTW
ncbi:MAG: VOC family protein [Acetobacteraceae bacterium]|nr:VOC family protein [Acetobacteraceae bacterium]